MAGPAIREAYSGGRWVRPTPRPVSPRGLAASGRTARGGGSGCRVRHADRNAIPIGSSFRASARLPRQPHRHPRGRWTTFSPAIHEGRTAQRAEGFNARWPRASRAGGGWRAHRIDVFRQRRRGARLERAPARARSVAISHPWRSGASWSIDRGRSPSRSASRRPLGPPVVRSTTDGATTREGGRTWEKTGRSG